MKKKYLKPSINVEVFEASEYVSTCVKSDVVGEGELWGENGLKNGLQTKGWNKDYDLGNRICRETHKFDKEPRYLHGYWKDDKGNVTNVYYWFDWGGDWKYHAVINKGDFSNSTTNAS